MTGCLFEIQPEARERDSDYCLYYNPKADSVFDHAWQRPTRFVKQNVELPYVGCPKYGGAIYVPLNLKRGQLLGAITLKYTFPGIRHEKEKIHRPKFIKKECRLADNDTSHCVVDDDDCDQNGLSSKHAYWVNSIGHAATEDVSFLIDDNEIIVHSGEFMEIFDELTTPIGKNTDEIIGRHRSLRSLWLKSKRKQVRYVPLRFFFCEYIEQALNICGIDAAKSCLKLRIRIADLCKTYKSCDGTVPRLIDSHHQLSEDHIKLTVYANVYFITYDELVKRFNSGHKHLITQVQYNGEEALKHSTISNIPHKINLPFCHKPISEVIWVVQSEEHIKNCDYYNWSGLHNDDPVEKVKIMVGGHVHTSEREGKWFRTMEPREHHTNIPGKHIYTWALAHCPERLNACTGSYTPKSDKDVQLVLKLQRGLKSPLFKCWATNWNVFEITPERIAGVAF